MRILILAAILGGFWVFGSDGIEVRGPERGEASVLLTQNTGPETVGLAEDDPDMTATTTDAVRASLPLFLAHATEAGRSVAGASIKVTVPIRGTGPDSHAIIWAGPFVWDGGDGFLGALANAPNQVLDLNVGELIEFRTDMVRDWSLPLSDGLIWGHHTTRVITTRLPRAQADAVLTGLSPHPVPSGWQ